MADNFEIHILLLEVRDGLLWPASPPLGILAILLNPHKLKQLGMVRSLDV
jgi:hypothetical protein